MFDHKGANRLPLYNLSLGFEGYEAMHRLLVKASKLNMTTTFICPTLGSALDHVQYLRKRGYQNVEITTSTGKAISADDIQAAFVVTSIERIQQSAS